MANNLKMMLLFLSFFFFISTSFGYAQPPVIENIIASDDKFLAGTVITITGNNFNKDNAEVKINYVSIHKECEITEANIKSADKKEETTSNCCVFSGNAEIVERTDKQIKARIPYDLLEITGLKAEIWVENKVDAKTTEASEKKQITITEPSETLVTEAIRLKKSGMSASEIAEYLHHQGEQSIEDHYNYQKDQPGWFTWFDAPSIDKISRKTFGNIHFKKDGSEVVRLREAGFENDFIEKMTGQPQYVTLGAAIVWLGQTHNYVIAPMARIFVQPTGFYTPRKPLDIRHLWSTWDWQRVGINIGYTPATPTTKTYGGNAEETKNYILIGLCYEINRSALLNFGIAVAPGGSVHGSRQFYAGFTLDQNILKGLGLMKD